MKQFQLSILLALLTSSLYAQERVTNVTVAPLSDEVIYPEFSIPATTLSINDSNISAETSGRIVDIPAQVGDRIEKGKILASLDCSNNQARLTQAKAALVATKAQKTLAQRQINRTQSLRKTKNISEELYNQRQANLETAKADQQAQQARLEEAELEVQRCQVLAPFTGIVMQRLKAEGEWVTPGQPVIQLLDSERLEVSAQVPIGMIPSLNNASSFTLNISDGKYSLKLRRLLPVVAERGRNREVRFIFSKTAALPGSTGRLVWRSSKAHLPADIPVRRKQELGVFLASKGKARFHPLPQALEGQPAPINLPLHSKIVIEGRYGLRDQDRIKIDSKSD
jgi:RND family efflux transporter MFP subunit